MCCVYPTWITLDGGSDTDASGDEPMDMPSTRFVNFTSLKTTLLALVPNPETVCIFRFDPDCLLQNALQLLAESEESDARTGRSS